MSNKLYLVSYIGMYRDSEGDHSHWLFDNEKDAVKCFKKQKEDCLLYYGDELKASFKVFYDDCNNIFSLETNISEDKVDIYITEITPDGTLAQTVL